MSELRYGWTTGACATAATKAAYTALTTGEFPDPVEITLPPLWAVDVENRGKMGGVDARVTDSAELPADAPTLHVITNAWFGGVEISA